MTSKAGTKLVAEINTLTVSIMVPLLDCETHCCFRNNSITLGLHTRQWTRQQLSHVYETFALSALSRQFPSGCLSNQAKSQPHARSRLPMCNFRVEICLRGSPRKHSVTPQSHCVYCLRTSLGPSGCLTFPDTAFPLLWLRLLHLSQTGPPGRKGGGRKTAANFRASHNTSLVES